MRLEEGRHPIVGLVAHDRALAELGVLHARPDVERLVGRLDVPPVVGLLPLGRRMPPWQAEYELDLAGRRRGERVAACPAPGPPS